ncbi:MAG: 3-isopropylmalate dehydratase small subunit [Hyphomicrobiales bacterium]
MQPFTALETVACPLPLANIDTDQLLPARFLKRPRAAGYGAFLLHDLRFGADGRGVGAFALDDPRYKGAQALVTRRNFGGGSSREGAVYALVDFGIRCVIAPSFGDIFASNSVINGLLPARLEEAEIEALLTAQNLVNGDAIRIDLATQRIVCGNTSYEFRIDPFWKSLLLNGWDYIDLTTSYSDEIAGFAAADAQRRPWAVPKVRPAT